MNCDATSATTTIWSRVQYLLCLAAVVAVLVYLVQLDWARQQVNERLKTVERRD